MIESRRRANKAGKLAGNSSSCCSPGLFQLLFASSFKARRYMREICASGAVFEHILHLPSGHFTCSLMSFAKKYIYSNMTKTKLI